jgi:CBS domain-containing protein
MTAALQDPIRFVMSSPVVTVDGTATLREAAGVMRDETIGAVAVVHDEVVVGLLSERDLIRAMADGADPDEVWAADLMAVEPLEVSPDDSMADAVQLMLDAGVRHLPVVRDGRLLGMVSMRDLVALLLRGAAFA